MNINILQGIKNFLMFVNDNWTMITIIIALAIAVAKKAKDLLEMLTNDKTIVASTVIAALFHDIGKCTKGFQEHLLNNTYQDYIPHNILSASIVHTHLNIKYDEKKMHMG